MAALVGFALFLGAGVVHLYHRHPAEDAFIVYTYVENLAAGRGIVYYDGGPRTEGYVDFLWMLLLAGLVRLGVDVAVSAMLLNAAGAAVAAALLTAAARRAAPGPLRTTALVLAVPVVVFGPWGMASLQGFATLLFAATAAVLYRLAADDGGPRAILWIPATALVLALIRLDGLVIAAGFGLIGLAAAWRRRCLGAYLVVSAAALTAFAAYFAWRYAYFGLPLPLPVLVKRGDGLNSVGVGDAVQWFMNRRGPLPPLMALAACAAIWRRLGGAPARLLAALLPAAALCATLLFMFPIQNVHFRFQAPFQLSATLALFAAAAAASAAAPGRRLLQALLGAILFLGVGPSTVSGVRGLLGEWRVGSPHAAMYAVEAGRVLRPGRTLLISVAGRMAYWSRGTVVDAGGLNTRETALREITAADIEALRPDVVMLYPAGILDVSGLEAREGVIELDAAELGRRIRGDFRFDADFQGFTMYGTMLRHLAGSGGRYRIFLARDEGHWDNVFGLRRDLPEADALAAALRRAASAPAAPYAAVKRFPFAGEA